ncbi:MAG: NAD-dependent epimerase/dehydratase family protein, partial [Candidatus Micrarchaeota archaeon]
MVDLVTGGSGRIGSKLIEELRKKGKKMRAYVLDCHERFLPQDVQLVVGDVGNECALGVACQGVDTVYHLAAIIDYSGNWKKIYEVNVKGTENVLKAAAKAGVKRFVYCSSTSAMGKRIPANANEETECKPTDLYGKSKLEAEKLVEKYAGKMEVVIVRPTIAYGRGFHDGFGEVLKMLKKGKMFVVGSGKNIIPLVHVDDIVQALALAGEKKEASGKKFIVCGEDNRSQEELFKLACEIMEVEPPKKHVPYLVAKIAAWMMEKWACLRGKQPKIIPEYIDVLGISRTYDISRLKSLGYKQKVKLVEGVKD